MSHHLGGSSPDVAWCEDTGAASWIIGRLHGGEQTVRAVIPDGYPAYCRILHPCWRERNGERMPVRWSELVSRIEPRSRIDELPLPADVNEPIPGTLTQDDLHRLVATLARHTGTPDDCWFGLWEGFGWLDAGRGESATVLGFEGNEPRPPWVIALADLPKTRLEIPERSLILYRGSIGAAAAFCERPPWQSPSLWWPSDRSWCVASDIDLLSTYVAGSESLIADVLADECLEAMAVEPDDPIG